MTGRGPEPRGGAGPSSQMSVSWAEVGGRVRSHEPLTGWGRARFGGRAFQAGIHGVTSTESKGQGEEGGSCHWGGGLKD